MSSVKRHHIRCKGLPKGSPEEWARQIKRVKGVINVEVNADEGDVFVEYDLEKCREEAIEHWLVQFGFILEDGLMERVKRGWIHYTEENELDALEAKPCCDYEEVERKKKELE